MGEREFPESIQKIWDSDSEGSKWIDDLLDEVDKLQGQNKQFVSMMEASQRINIQLTQKLDTLIAGLRKLLEYNYMDLCRSDVENLIRDSSTSTNTGDKKE